MGWYIFIYQFSLHSAFLDPAVSSKAADKIIKKKKTPYF